MMLLSNIQICQWRENMFRGEVYHILLDQQWILMWSSVLKVLHYIFCKENFYPHQTKNWPNYIQHKYKKTVTDTKENWIQSNSVSFSRKALYHTCEHLKYSIYFLSKTHLHPSESHFITTTTETKQSLSPSLLRRHQIFHGGSSPCKPWDHLMACNKWRWWQLGLEELPAPTVPSQVPHTWLHQCPAPRLCRTLRLSGAAGAVNLPSVGSWSLNISHFLLLLKAAGGRAVLGMEISVHLGLV